MRPTALRRARSWTLGILSASAVAAALVGFHLAEDHSAALAAARTTGAANASGSSGTTTTVQPPGDDHDGDQADRADRADRPDRPDDSSQPAQQSFSSPGQLAPGSGAPQVTTHGS